MTVPPSKEGGRPRLLDLFCGAGGCSVGYERAGFEVVGVDIKPQPNYPFEFVQMDALGFLRDGCYRWHEFGGPFDAIHASPPCQAYTTMNNRRGSDSPALIGETRELLLATGLPYVIENVVGARAWLRGPVLLTGEMFGLSTSRPRLFETSWHLMVPKSPRRQKNAAAVYGKLDGRRLWTRSDGSELRAVKTLEEGREAMAIDWMEWDELREAIPPAYTELIGHQLVQHLSAQVAA